MRQLSCLASLPALEAVPDVRDAVEEDWPAQTGGLRDVRVYDRALTDAEVQELAAARGLPLTSDYRVHPLR